MLAPFLTVVLYPLGVLLLWLSPQWTSRDKWIGTLALPGGLYAAWFITTHLQTDCRSASGAPVAAGQPGCPAPLGYEITHPFPSWGINHVFGPIVVILLIVIPILAAFYLELRLRRKPV